MKDLSVSIKVGDTYKTVINIKEGKYGPQLAFSPDFRPVLLEWLKAPEAAWLNMNIKVWDDKPSTQQSGQAQAQRVEDTDSIPF